MLRRAVLAALTAVPGPVASRARTASGGSRLAERAANLALRALGDEPVPIRTGPARGLLMQPAVRSLVWLTGKVEPDVQRVLVEHVRSGDTVVDAGASIGFHTLLLAHLVGDGGTVLSFEPSPVDAAALRVNARLNGFATVHVSEHALSRETGAAFLDQPGEATARLVATDASGALPVETTTLDAVLASRPGDGPSLVKIDVEGHEAAVLDGMHETLRGARPVLVIELHGDGEVVPLLERAGYATSGLGRPAGETPGPGAHLVAVPR